MSRTAHVTLETRLRRITGLAVVAAASLRARKQAAVTEVAPVPQLASNPTKVAAGNLYRAYKTLKQADPSASDAELFRNLRLMMNRLENGGLRRPPAHDGLAQQPSAVAVSLPERRRDAWLTGLRDRSRGLSRAILG